MKCFISYERHNADTINGEMLTITYRFSTFDKAKMDEFEKELWEKIGSGIMGDIDETN